MNLASVIVLLVVLALVVLAIRAMRMGKSQCSCGENGKMAENGGKCASCSVDCPFKR